jgi:hypothetical protein
MGAELRDTLLMVADAMALAQAPWWIIASAAAALHGAEMQVADVDLLVGMADGEALLARLGLSSDPRPSERFRSDLFARWTAPPLPVEIMAGFHVLDGAEWRPVCPATRIVRRLGHTTLYAPSVAELIEHGLLFGRPKDLARATILQRLQDEAGMQPPSA